MPPAGKGSTVVRYSPAIGERPGLASVRSALQRGGRALLSPTAIRGAAVEALWLGTHAAAWPFGFRQERHGPARERTALSNLRPRQRGLLVGDVVAAGTPIVLVHGLVDNRSIFTLLRRSLRKRGFGRVVTHSYSVLSTDVASTARRLGAEVERLCAETGYDRVHVVGHSLGGLVARYYVQRLGGDARVHTLITLGTPHGGSRAAQPFPTPLCRQLRPGSPLLAELAQPAPGCRTRFLAFYSDLDQLVVPHRAARIEHPDLTARNVLVRGVGHLSLPINPGIVREIASTLAHLDPDGSILAAGTTPISSTAPSVPAPRSPAASTRGEPEPAEAQSAEAQPAASAPAEAQSAPRPLRGRSSAG